MIGRGGVAMWHSGGLGQAIMPGDTGPTVDPTQPVDTSASGGIPTGTGIQLSPGVNIPNPFASWGSGEWIVAVVGAFAVYSLLHTAGEGVGGFTSWRKRRRARKARQRELEQEYYTL